MPDRITKVPISRIDRRPTRGWDVDKTRAARACLSCRSRKVKCTGELPTCKRCIEGHQPCVYRQRQNARRSAPERTSQIRTLIDDLGDRIAEEDRRDLEDFFGEIPNYRVTSTGEPINPAIEADRSGSAANNIGDVLQAGQSIEALVNNPDVVVLQNAEAPAETRYDVELGQDQVPGILEVNDVPHTIWSRPTWPGDSSSFSADGPEHVTMDGSTLLQLLWYLQTNSGKDARRFLDSWSWRGTGGSSGQAEVNDHGERAVPNLAHSLPFSKTTGEMFGDTQRCVSEVNRPLLSSLQPAASFAHETTIATIKLAVDIFFKSSCLLFYIFPKEQIETILMGDLQRPDETHFAEVLNTCSTLEAKARLAEICGMTAVGLLYLREFDDTMTPPARLGDYFYNLTKQLLDSAIESNPFRAMKVCALLCMYNIYIHARVAVAFVEFGLGLAKTFGLSQQYPSKLSLEEYLDYRRTWRTLLCFSGWLAASLGYAPGQASSTLYLLQNESEGRAEDVIQRELVKVTIIKAKILRAISDGDPIDDVTIEAFKQELKVLEASLPAWMKVRSLLSSTRSSSPQRRTAMYFHLFFLSAMQLLCRLPMANSVQMTLLPTRQIAQGAMMEGLIAAELAARLLNLMRLEGLVVKICWMCIYCSYSTGTILLHKTAQKILHGKPPSSWNNDLHLAKTCIDTLAFCGDKDKVAAGLYSTLSKYLDVIEANLSRNQEAQADFHETPAEDIDPDYLLSVPIGDTALHKAARDLLRLIQFPFDTNLELLQTAGSQSSQFLTNSVNIFREAVETPHEWNFELDTLGFRSDAGNVAGGCDVRVRNVMEGIDQGSFVNVGNANPWSLWTPQEV